MLYAGSLHHFTGVSQVTKVGAIRLSSHPHNHMTIRFLLVLGLWIARSWGSKWRVAHQWDEEKGDIAKLPSIWFSFLIRSLCCSIMLFYCYVFGNPDFILLNSMMAIFINALLIFPWILKCIVTVSHNRNVKVTRALGAETAMAFLRPFTCRFFPLGVSDTKCSGGGLHSNQ